MNTLEDRLRAAMRHESRRAPDANPVPLRLPRRVGGRTRTARRARILMAPLAAAAALAAVAAGIVVVRSASGPAHRAAAGPAALPALPSYEVALTYVGRYRGWKLERTVAVVARTATGRPVATIRPPAPYNAFVAISGSADGRSYVLAAEHLARPRPGAPMSPPTRLYVLRVRPGGAALTPLPGRVPGPARIGAMALSPDGSQLAVTSSAVVGQVAVRVYNVATGRVTHDWAVPVPPRTDTCCTLAPAVSSPSWEAGGRYLAVDVDLPRCQDCVMLLDTHAAGATVQAVGRVVVRKDHLPYAPQWTSTIITADGGIVLRSATAMIPIAPASQTFRGFPHVFGYSVRSGRQTSDVRGSRYYRWTLLWASPDGRSFVAAVRSIRGGWQAFPAVESYRAGRWSRLPVPAQTVTVAW